MKRIALLVLIFVLGASSLFSQMINVPGDKSSIQDAIDSSTDGDTVLVSEGTFFENINYRGKAITIASQFLIDGDTSHISKTIIDGSQSTILDSSSTVIFSLECDTTSALIGFTVTGGAGTLVEHSSTNWDRLAGGGIAFIQSGGKVTHNIIEDNHLLSTHVVNYSQGCGIFAINDNDEKIVIRENVIRNNSGTGQRAIGGGISLDGGNTLIEDNSILNNILSSVEFSDGGGIAWINLTGEESTMGLTIRRNEIYGNATTIETGYGFGGGIDIAQGLGSDEVHIYNNLIVENHSNLSGGGIFMENDLSTIIIYNNTMIDNEADYDGNSIGYETNVNDNIVLFNNIIWSEVENGKAEFFSYKTISPIIVYYNIMKEEIDPSYLVQAGYNIYNKKPDFNLESYSLAEFSPGVGQGIDSLMHDGILYLAPSDDLFKNPRPNPIDDRIDIGAIESSYEGIVVIPDANFLAALIEDGVDTDEDGLIRYEEAEAVTLLDVSEKSISDLTGIEAFVNLDTLDCRYNQLTSLDVSNNTGLASLNCSENQLTELDVSVNISLRELDCSENQLSSLDVSNNIDLGEGSSSYGAHEFNCSNNKITSLDLSNNHKLISVDCSNNQLTSLDISSCIQLIILDCSNNKFTTLDISKNIKLTQIGGEVGCCYSKLDLSNMPSLYQVCVWELPFPPEGYDEVVDTTGSPNICFDTICDGVCGSVPVFEKFTSTELGIYPNPTSSLLTIETDNPDCYSLEIHSLNGQLIYKEEMEGTSKEIDLTPFSKGIYFITVRSKKFVRTEKVVKL